LLYLEEQKKKEKRRKEKRREENNWSISFQFLKKTWAKQTKTNINNHKQIPFSF